MNSHNSELVHEPKAHTSEWETGEKQLETRPPWAYASVILVGSRTPDMTTTPTSCTFDHHTHDGIEDGCAIFNGSLQRA
jgi:hypothetical protein